MPMKKFFILLTGLILIPQISFAGVISAADTKAPAAINTEKNMEKLRNLYKEIPDINDTEALQKYIEKRLKIIKSANFKPEELLQKRTVSIIDTEKLNSQQQETLSAYEKIYQESLKRAESNAPLNEETELDGNFYEYVHKKQQNKAFVPDFPYVNIKLSDKREIMVPAEEHIAYLLTTINIETNGLMRVNEEFVFVSNNEGFPQGFFRILPKYTYSRSGSKRRLALSLQSVLINGEEYPYKITEIGNYLYIEPKESLNLPTGVYTYHFNYLIDRNIWSYDNFDEMYWDITGKTLKNVIGSANAVVTLPSGQGFLAQNAIANTRFGLLPSRVTITNLDDHTLAFADTEALAVGEDIHLYITLQKGTLLPPSLTQRYFWFIQDYGAEFFSLIALLAIFLAYKISLKQIRRNQDKTKAVIKKSPAIFRLFNVNLYDERSLLSEILDLISKNIIGIEKSGEDTVLIKKTDDLKKLSKQMQALVKILFPGAETALPSNNLSKLKLERAYKYLKRKTYHAYNRYVLKLNSMYILFNSAMLFCGIIAASLISVNPSHTFWIITICNLLMIPCLCLALKEIKRRGLNIFIKLFSLIFILGISGWLSIYTSKFYALLMIASLWTIIYYYREFSRRNGLLRHKIKETEEYKSYLQKNPELAASAKDFGTRIPYIYAFAIENKYKQVETFDLIHRYDELLTTIK